MSSVSIVVKMNIDVEEGYYKWNGKYEVLSNDIPKDQRLSVAEGIAQSDDGQFNAIDMVVEAVEKSGRLQQGCTPA